MRIPTAIFLTAISLWLLPSCGGGGVSGSQNPEDIIDVKWEIMSMNGRTVNPNPEGLLPFFKLNPQKQGMYLVGGLGGCNRFMARYSLEGGNLKINATSGTQSSCPYMDTEQEFLETLKKTDSYALEDGKLRLMSEGKTTMVFVEGEDI